MSSAGSKKVSEIYVLAGKKKKRKIVCLKNAVRSLSQTDTTGESGGSLRSANYLFLGGH